MTATCLLIGDIGGTNARFALADAGTPGFSRLETLLCADFESADAAIDAYLRSVDAGSPVAICLAVAGPIVDRRVRFTNNHWELSADGLASRLSINAVHLLNDFEAIAWSIPFLDLADLVTIGTAEPRPLDVTDFTIGVIGPGTGLGAAALCKRGELLLPIAGEAGHGGFAPETRVQIELLNVLRERFDRISTERLVSGPGLQNIYRALARIRGASCARLSAAETFDAAVANRDELASEAVQLFFEILGQTTGDLALAFGAGDGMFIAGGIARRYPELLNSSRFRTGFESKGRYRSVMENIPTQLIVHEQPGLLGAAVCALRMSRS